MFALFDEMNRRRAVRSLDDAAPRKDTVVIAHVFSNFVDVFVGVDVDDVDIGTVSQTESTPLEVQ